MNIGIFTDTYYPEINGVANSTHELKKGLESLGHTVYLFTVSNPAASLEDESGIFRIASVPFPMLKERRIGVTVSKVWKRKVRRLHLDVIHTQTEFIMGHLGRKMADYLGVPHIHTYHTIYEDYLSYLHMPDKPYFRKAVQRFSRSCCNRADEIIVPTGKVRGLLNRYGVQREVHVIPSGISLRKFSSPDKQNVNRLRRQLGISEDKQVLLYVGRLSAEKNISELLTYIREAENRERPVFLLVGDGPEREALERQVRELCMEETVIFAGMASFDKIEDYYALGDIFVSASTSETQGLTYIEAMAAGMPLLVKRDECLKGVLREYENGISYTEERSFQQGLAFLSVKGKTQISPAVIRKSVEGLDGKTFAKQVEMLYLDRIEKWDVKRNEENNGTIHAA
ncbi:MAG: glycosyltransferase [Bacteroidales bacterium]|nr:glycosyltransferase [Clostridium sp.]MCM1205019.1 glycosyltransferase [Bacteroidales bacterium]